jgi:hypothetical protein
VVVTDDPTPNALSRCTRSLTRPGAASAADEVDWWEFCDPAAGRLSRSAREWQRLGGFRHHRAGTVLVVFRASWLALCATIPEYHLGLPVPSLLGTRVAIGHGGLVEGLVLSEKDHSPVAGSDRAHRWWRDITTFIAPLTRGLAALGGPSPDSDQYWGNAVGLIGEVLRRLAADGADGDPLATAMELRAATGRDDLLEVRATPRGLWSRRRTCCQLWRCGAGFCTECVLHDAPARTRDRQRPAQREP